MSDKPNTCPRCEAKIFIDACATFGRPIAERTLETETMMEHTVERCQANQIIALKAKLETSYETIAHLRIR